MGDDKSSIPMASRDRDRELLIPVADSLEDGVESKPSSSSSASSSHHSGREGYFKELTSLDGSGSTLVDKICEENIQLFMRCEEHRQKETDLKQMIDKLEAELEETRKKSAQLRSNLENQRQQRHRD